MNTRKKSIRVVAEETGLPDEPLDRICSGEPLYSGAHLCFVCGGRDFFPVPIGDPVCLTCHPMSFPEVNR